MFLCPHLTWTQQLQTKTDECLNWYYCLWDLLAWSQHKKNTIDIPVANITCVIVAAMDVLTCIMWLIISRVQGMRVRWAGTGNFDASSLTAFKILSSNVVQHWTNVVQHWTVQSSDYPVLYTGHNRWYRSNITFEFISAICYKH